MCTFKLGIIRLGSMDSLASLSKKIPIVRPELKLWTSFGKITSERRRPDAFGRLRVRMNIHVGRPPINGQSALWMTWADGRSVSTGGRPLTDGASGWTVLRQSAQPPYSQENLFSFIELIHHNTSFRIIIVSPLFSFIFICKSGDTVEVCNAPRVT
jgi:hypothetical protein